MHQRATRPVSAVLAAVLLAVCSSPGAQPRSGPFTREVEDFVSIYLKHGGDKLTNWVQQDTTASPEEALRAFRTVDNLTMELVAAEPIIRQPIDLHFDERGRLWVVQYLQYPFPAGLTVTSYDQYLRATFDRVPAPPPQGVRGADKITVLEDQDGDGRFESHTDVITGLNIATSVLTGRGGVWVMNPPYLLFYRDVTGDGLPDGDPEVRLEGFGIEDTHSLANSLTWGPDGWLYGVHGSTSTARVRGISFLGQAVWRYHPERDRFELFAEGGGNPWTLSFDSRGRAFSGDNGGNSRGFHWVQGGRYEKNFPKHGPFTRPHSYGHLAQMPHDGDTARFAMTSVVYEEGKLPKYEGQLISGMALTSRIQASRLVRDGSTFRTVDTDPLVTTTNRSFRPVDTAVGPDGAVYVADWCDIRMDHTDPRDTWDKSCGRVWRLRARDARPVAPANLGRRSDAELLGLLGHEAKWYRDQARRLLGERKDAGVAAPLRQRALETNGWQALEALWTANLISGLDSEWAAALLSHADPAVRAWTVRLVGDGAGGSDRGRTGVGPRSGARALGDALIALAGRETDHEVRSQLAGTAVRLDVKQALPILQALIQRSDAIEDRHIPLRTWWALEECITKDADGVLNWLARSNVWAQPLFAEHLAERVARRLAADRGRQSFTRMDPAGDLMQYARHPRSRLPGGKGDYTEWAPNFVREISDRNLTRLVRLIDMAPAAQRQRLLAGAQAGLAHGAPAPRLPSRLAALVGTRPAGSDPANVPGERGREGFLTHCAPCHQTDGTGMARLATPLRHSKWVLGRDDVLARIVLHGLAGEMLMPPMGTLDDRQLAAILTYVRTAWGHRAGPILPERIAAIRAASRGRSAPWTIAELSALAER